MLERLTMCASLSRWSIGVKNLQPCTTPQKLMPISHCISSNDTSASVPISATPALLINNDARPKSRCTACAKASTAGALETSTVYVRAMALRSRARVSSKPTALTSASASCAPIFARSTARARPIPEAAPVMTATAPLISCIGGKA